MNSSIVKAMFNFLCNSQKRAITNICLPSSSSIFHFSSWFKPVLEGHQRISKAHISVVDKSKSSAAEVHGIEPVRPDQDETRADGFEVLSSGEKTFTLEEAISSNKMTNCTGLLQSQFEKLSAEQRKCIIDCYNDLLPYEELLDEIIEMADEKILELVFSDINIWERQVLLEISINRQKLIGSENVSDEEKDLEFSEASSTGQAKQQDEPIYVSTSPHLWTRSADMNRMYRHFGYQSLQHGHPLIIDCAFERSMRGREIKSYIQQIEHLITQNMRCYDPYHIYLCNMPEESYLKEAVNYPVTNTTQCYTQMFDKDNLIMLSPDAPFYMEEYDPSKIYIIGGIVDLAEATPLTYSKAQALGIKAVKLPIDICKIWTAGSKRLTLTAVLGILANLNSGKDWEAAIMPNLPQRYHKSHPNSSRQIKDRYIKNVLEYKKRFQVFEANHRMRNNPKQTGKKKQIPLIRQMTGDIRPM